MANKKKNLIKKPVYTIAKSHVTTLSKKFAFH